MNTILQKLLVASFLCNVFITTYGMQNNSSPDSDNNSIYVSAVSAMPEIQSGVIIDSVQRLRGDYYRCTECCNRVFCNRCRRHPVDNSIEILNELQRKTTLNSTNLTIDTASVFPMDNSVYIVYYRIVNDQDVTVNGFFRAHHGNPANIQISINDKAPINNEIAPSSLCADFARPIKWAAKKINENRLIVGGAALLTASWVFLRTFLNRFATNQQENVTAN